MTDNDQPSPRVPQIAPIVASIKRCYGDLDQPSFAAAASALQDDVHRPFKDALEAHGVEVIDTTDLNDDVATMLALAKGGDKLALGLSAVGPYAVLHHVATDGRLLWVGPGNSAPTALAGLVDKLLGQAGFQLLDRSTALQAINMGGDEVSLYRALFTDTGTVL